MSSKKWDPEWPGKHTISVDRSTYNPYNVNNESLQYGTKKDSVGIYQYSMNKVKNMKLASNDMSDNMKSAIKDEGLPLSTASTFRRKAFTQFSKFGYIDPYGRMYGKTKEVLFFTKPDLHLVSPYDKNKLANGLSNAPFFMELFDNNLNIIKELQYTYPKNKDPFIHLLHNRVRDTLDLPDISSNDIDIPVNMYGNDYSYRGSSEPSDDQFTFNLEFEDNKYLDVYTLFRVYEEYERYKKLGIVAPLHRYVSRKILHDQITIFKFTLADDFSTIVHYAELWGCYPTGLPRSVFGSDDFSSSGLTLSIPWKCAFVEDMNPLIITDFNELMKEYADSKDIDLVLSNGRINRTDWADGAYITREKANPNDDNSRYVYKLKWRKD